MSASIENRLRCAVVTIGVLAACGLLAEGPYLPAALTHQEPPGSDVFVTAGVAVVREKPSTSSRIVGKLPGGARLLLLEAGEQYIKVEIAAGAGTGDSRAAAIGFVSRAAVCVFPPDDGGTADLVASGRVLSGSEPHRRLAVAFLLRASARLRAGSHGDPTVEIQLAEAAEALATAGGPFPAELEVTRAPGEPARWRYCGDAFHRALALTGPTDGEGAARLRDRATAGGLRQQYGETSSSLTALWSETAAWLALAESTRDPLALRSSAERLGLASLSLGRLLVAAGRLQELATVKRRVAVAAMRTRAALPKETAGRKLSARVAILSAMEGNGTPPFPQEARARVGPKEVVARIGGELGALSLTVETVVGGSRDGPRKKAAIPVLPVPGSLRLSPDGRSAAWLEIAGPSRILPVIASLEKDESARPIARLSEGRPLRDCALAHVVTSLTGYSKDGQRLGLSFEAWNETPGPRPRYSVISVATGELIFETSRNRKAYRRRIE